jgi:hypothetical protein
MRVRQLLGSKNDIKLKAINTVCKDIMQLLNDSKAEFRIELLIMPHIHD